MSSKGREAASLCLPVEDGGPVPDSLGTHGTSVTGALLMEARATHLPLLRSMTKPQREEGSPE